MSAPALALAIRDTIQANVLLNGNPIDENTCDVGFDGAPKVGAGQMYIAVHLGAWTPQSGDWDLYEEFSVAVTVTLRLGEAPQDRFGAAVWAKAQTGLDAVCRKIICLLHQNQSVRLAANHGNPYSIGDTGSGPDGFYTTVQFVRGDAPVYRDARWFLGGASPVDEMEAAQSGVSCTLTFGKAQRGQTIAGMT